jgi:predicted ester cyclase
MFGKKRFLWFGLPLALVLGGFALSALAQSDGETSPAENKALIAAYFEAISGKEKPAALQEQYIADSDQALKDHIDMFEAAFPLYELIAEDMIAEGDEVAVRATFRGTHQGEFSGIPATGNEVEIPVFLIYRIEDGKIVEHWMQADVMGLLQQLGALPAPDASS